MKTHFAIQDGSLVECDPDRAAIIVCAEPDDREKQELLATLPIDQYDLESALDPDEIPRVEVTPERTYVIWKHPDNVSFEEHVGFNVSSVGLCLQSKRVTMIFRRRYPGVFSSREFRKVASLTDFVLKFLLVTVHHYLGHLKAMQRLAAELQDKLNASMENRYLLQMFALSESLVYYLNALETSASVLLKLRGNAEKMGLTPAEIALLDDVVIEHQQCSTQAKIYSSIFSGLMDARGNIINNNMNVLLKNLTLINVVFLPLNLIASIGGMSEFSTMTHGVPVAIAYTLFGVGMAVLGYVIWFMLTRRIAPETRRRRRRKRTPASPS